MFLFFSDGLLTLPVLDGIFSTATSFSTPSFCCQEISFQEMNYYFMEKFLFLPFPARAPSPWSSLWSARLVTRNRNVGGGRWAVSFVSTFLTFVYTSPWALITCLPCPLPWGARLCRFGPVLLISASCTEPGPSLAHRRSLTVEACWSLWQLTCCQVHLGDIGSLWQLATGGG